MKFKKGYFIIGTDTNIGKTYISSMLYNKLKRVNGIYYKPIQSGCLKKEGELIAPDVDFVCKNNKEPYNKEMVTYCLESEVSPHLASELAGIKINLKNIENIFKNLKKKYKYILVEGAGGLFVPLVRNKLYIYDLIKKFNLPVILVCETRVGSINHALLTYTSLKNMGIKIQGILFNRANTEIYYEKDNIDVIIKMTKVKKYLVVDERTKELSLKEVFKFLEIEGDKND